MELTKVMQHVKDNIAENDDEAETRLAVVKAIMLLALQVSSQIIFAEQEVPQPRLY